MENRSFITVTKPPAEVFEKDSAALQASEFEAVQGELFDRMEYPFEIVKKPDGIFAYYYDHPYPTKGQPYPGAVDTLQCAKKLILGTIGFLRRHYILAVFFYLLPNFIKMRYLRSFLFFYVENYTMAAMKPNFLEKNRYCKFAREIMRAGFTAIERLPVDAELKTYCKNSFRMLVEIAEYDNAHRYRGQDALGCLDKKAFAENPSREVSRLVRINQERERGYIHAKTRYEKMESVLRLALKLNKGLERFLKDFVSELDLDQIKLDEADIYHNLLRPDYDICGWPIEERQKKYIEIFDKYQKDYPGRVQEGKRKRQKLESAAQLMLVIEKSNGTPFMMFSVSPAEKGSEVRMFETKLSTSTPQLREACFKILEERVVPTASSAPESKKDA